MKTHMLGIGAGLTVLAATLPAHGDFVDLEYEWSCQDIGGQTYCVIRLYAAFDDTADQLLAVAASPTVGTIDIDSPCGDFYQDPLAGDFPPSAALIDAFPDVEFDSYLTIGNWTEEEAGDSGPPLVSPGFPPSGWGLGGAGLHTTNGAWGRPNIDPLTIAGDDFRVGFAQITVPCADCGLLGAAASLTGTLNLAVRENGVYQEIVGLQLTNVHCAPLSGACCFDDGSCLNVVGAAECHGMGGRYRGALTDCATVQCTGACCDVDGTCTPDQSVDECNLFGGVYLGDDTTCDGDPCSQPGACCFPDGSCRQEMTTDDTACIIDGGFYLGDETICGVDPCPQPGACCFPDGSCRQETTTDDTACIDDGGSYLGDDTVCDPNPCPQPGGACCFTDGRCFFLTESHCVASGHSWQGFGSTCQTVSCPHTGACCVDGTCIGTMFRDECIDTNNGTWYEDEICTGAPPVFKCLSCGSPTTIYDNGEPQSGTGVDAARCERNVADGAWTWIVDDVTFDAEVIVRDLHWWGQLAPEFDWQRTADLIVLADDPGGGPGAPIIEVSDRPAAGGVYQSGPGEDAMFFRIAGLDIHLAPGTYFFGMRCVSQGPGDGGFWLTRPVGGSSEAYRQQSTNPAVWEPVSVAVGTAFDVAFCVTSGDACPADTTGDGMVDTDDLLLVLVRWGDCPSPCPPYCAGDTDSDCIVYIDDFYAVLSDWGACPLP